MRLSLIETKSQNSKPKVLVMDDTVFNGTSMRKTKTSLKPFNDKYDFIYCAAYLEGNAIDEVNIYNASRMAMQRAIENMEHDFDLVLTDAMKMPNYPKPVVDIIHGDAQSMCIAAASILAKVSRDRLCLELDEKYPQYNIKKNKGYGTKDHLEALKEYGPVKHLHRFTYAPVRACFIEKVSLF
jgi:ribonuclease HII